MLHIYIVSLKQDIEKREVISKTLEDFGLEFSFIDAVYGKALSESDLNLYRNKSTGKIISRGFSATPGEIGCTLSHLKAYQEIIDRKLKWACILEDDAILDERFKTFIDSFQSAALNPKDLYILGGQNGLDERQIIESIKNTKLVGSQNFSKTIRSEQFIYRTCCYLISSSLAKEILRISKNEFILADDWNYLVKNKNINNIYISKFVDHPKDLSLSILQKEREKAVLSRTSNPSSQKKRILTTTRNFLQPRLRLLALKSYRFIEKKHKSE
ncbi:Glycosyltransferase family 25 protein [Psychrobacter okhotskensis]|uniref:glycosyltransferase family 25 protein n=1 Tax=Psychrobacter okhotskensis TaxID=212403 RepID=UPI003F56B298